MRFGIYINKSTKRIYMKLSFILLLLFPKLLIASTLTAEYQIVKANYDHEGQFVIVLSDKTLTVLKDKNPYSFVLLEENKIYKVDPLNKLLILIKNNSKNLFTKKTCEDNKDTSLKKCTCVEYGVTLFYDRTTQKKLSIGQKKLLRTYYDFYFMNKDTDNFHTKMSSKTYEDKLIKITESNKNDIYKKAPYLKDIKNYRKFVCKDFYSCQEAIDIISPKN